MYRHAYQHKIKKRQLFDDCEFSLDSTKIFEDGLEFKLIIHEERWKYVFFGSITIDF